MSGHLATLDKKQPTFLIACRHKLSKWAVKTYGFVGNDGVWIIYAKMITNMAVIEYIL